MRMGMMAMMVAAVGLNFGIIGCIQHGSEKRTSTLSMAERVKAEAVTGRVESVTGMTNDSYILIKINPENTRLVHTDDHTKMDKVAVGDRVKAFVTDDDYAAIIQHKGVMPSSGGYSLMGSGTP